MPKSTPNEMKDVIIKNLVESNKRLQAEVEILRSSIHTLEENEAATNQYGRCNNIEMSGVPSNVEDSDLETKVMEILQEIQVEVEPRDIEACHIMSLGKNQEGPKKVNRWIHK